jgi:hypothetical protein
LSTEVLKPAADEDPAVVGDRALGAPDGGGQLRHRRGAFEDQIEDGRSQRVGHRAQLGRRRHDGLVVQVVVGHRAIDRHFRSVPLVWIDP